MWVSLCMGQIIDICLFQRLTPTNSHDPAQHRILYTMLRILRTVNLLRYVPQCTCYYIYTALHYYIGRCSTLYTPLGTCTLFHILYVYSVLCSILVNIQHGYKPSTYSFASSAVFWVHQSVTVTLAEDQIVPDVAVAPTKNQPLYLMEFPAPLFTTWSFQSTQIMV